jgi:hypothetical protein
MKTLFTLTPEEVSKELVRVYDDATDHHKKRAKRIEDEIYNGYHIFR